VLDQLCLAMSNGAPNPTSLIIYGQGGGHSITPYAVEHQSNGVFWVKVYDNNHPDDANRYVVVDTAANTWSYDLGGTTWSGNASSHSLGAIPISYYAVPPVCPWCLWQRTSTLNDGASVEVWLGGPGHLLITDAEGRRIGYVADQFVNEIPGAIGSVLPGGMGVASEPIYQLPLDGSYTISLDGQTVSGSGLANVTQFGPGYAVSVNGVAVGSGSQDHLVVTQDGTGISYQSATDKEVSLAMILGGDAGAIEFGIQGTAVGAGQAAVLKADASSGQLVFNNGRSGGSEYDLVIARTSAAGRQGFVHSGIHIVSADTHYVAYSTWPGTGSMTLYVDHGSDGTLDEVVPLENETRTMFLPLLSSGL
jgi:hypothetical protein